MGAFLLLLLLKLLKVSTIFYFFLNLYLFIYFSILAVL